VSSRIKRKKARSPFKAKTPVRIWVGALEITGERDLTAQLVKIISTLFGSLAVMTSIAGFRPITLRRQFSLVLPVRRSGDHGQQADFRPMTLRPKLSLSLLLSVVWNHVHQGKWI